MAPRERQGVDETFGSGAVLVDGSGLSGEMADRYLRKSVSICGSFVVRVNSRPFAVLFCALCALLRLSRLCYLVFAERVSFELVNGFFDAAGARFWGLGTSDRYGDRLFFAVG
jgi:hypothetical protein